ncbi:MAG: nucleotidyltransferase domain-containing protein [Desulfobacteria bacterium]
MKREEEIRRTESRSGKYALFGSYARGQAGKWSDIDVAFVSPDYREPPEQDTGAFLPPCAQNPACRNRRNPL